MQIMKNISKYLLALSAVAFLLAGCKKEVETYEPGPADPSDTYGVYFPVQEATGSHTYDPDMAREIEFTVSRTNSKGAVTVPFTTNVSDEGVFKFGTINFADGQKETTLKVTFDAAKVGTEYSLSVTLDDDNAMISHYNSGAISLDFSVLIVTWEYFLNPVTKEKAVFTFTQKHWGETAWAYVRYYEVDGVRHCFTETFDHEYKGEHYQDPGFFGTANAVGGDGEISFIWYTKETNSKGYPFVEVPIFNYYVNSNYPDYIVQGFDYYYYWTVVNPQDALAGMSWLEFAKKYNDDYPCSYYDNNGGFYIYIKTYYMLGLGGWTQDAWDIIGLADGFTRVDYTLNVDADYSDEGETPVYLEAGVDIVSVDYAVYEGELSNIQKQAKIDAMTAGEEEVMTFSDFELGTNSEGTPMNYGTLLVSAPKTGNYTIVVIGKDEKGEVQANGSDTFRYIAAEDAEDYAVDLNVFTEDTPERYRELHSYDSFAFGIYGSDLKEVHVGIFSEADIEEYGEDYVFEAVKFDNGEEPQFTLSDEDVAKVNAAGGLYDVVTDLKGKTTYYVIVWATNGDLDAFDYASYETDPLPYVWNSLGTGTLTDGFFVDMFSDRPDYTVACDFYQEASDPGLYMITGFQQELSGAFFGMSKEDMAPYENGNWRNAQVIIDAHDPDAVVIPDQDYGVLVNKNYGWIMIGTEATGKLADGVLTFPTKQMYVYLGGWYYANNRGTFKLVFPSADAPAPAPTAVTASAQKPTDATLSSTAVRWNKPTVKYERDPQPVKVSVKVSYDRQERSTAKNDAPATAVARESIR